MGDPVSFAEHNAPHGNPPYALQNPLMNGRVKWLCNWDQDKNLISVFSNDDPDMSVDGIPDKLVNKHNSVEEVKRIRDTLKDSGWVPLEAPNIEFTDSSGNKVDNTKGGPLTRAEKRYLKRKLERASKRQKQLTGQK